jgi:5-methylcytosine-specific restriction protein B
MPEYLPQSSPPDEKSYWIVGAAFDHGKSDQTSRFLAENIWENGNTDRYLDLIKSMRRGDRIAIKSALVRKHDLPFTIPKGSSAAVMRIKATGTIVENFGDGRKIRVVWDPPSEPRDWYFFTYLITVAKIPAETEEGERLIDFVFKGGKQNYDWWLKRPFWANKYGFDEDNLSNGEEADDEAVVEESVDDDTAYTIAKIVEDGCFLNENELNAINLVWNDKKNLVIQGPPGTGKTWLAKRLAYARIGSKEKEKVRSRIRVIQFHPSLAYEDFVRGWRPGADGKLMLVDGILMQAINAAISEPSLPFVLVIEEINRGNPSQVFGEMLTLLENTKRDASEAMELAYQRPGSGPVYVPDNLYVIGTMNVADRSLAIVDFALRRRFAFFDLEPKLGETWREWCLAHGLSAEFCKLIKARLDALNSEISSSKSLGKQFRIGHSYVTPEKEVKNDWDWFCQRIETEIGPLLDEYWYDSPETALAAKTKLLATPG